VTEQLPGELIYEYTISSTGVTSYGVPVNGQVRVAAGGQVKVSIPR
jgi:hypothetical protein